MSQKAHPPDPRIAVLLVLPLNALKTDTRVGYDNLINPGPDDGAPVFPFHPVDLPVEG